jgi:hypothetical protein
MTLKVQNAGPQVANDPCSKDQDSRIHRNGSNAIPPMGYARKRLCQDSYKHTHLCVDVVLPVSIRLAQLHKFDFTLLKCDVIRNPVHLLSSHLAVLGPATIIPYSNCVVDPSHLAIVVVTLMTRITVMAATATVISPV